MKRLGVLGGLGPMATAYFLRLVVEMTAATTDQEHIEVILHSKPQIPDRTQFILGNSQDNPLPPMIDAGKKIVEHGAQVLAIPCITAHYFQQDLENAVGIPIINAITETALYLHSEGVRSIGILATNGTLESRLFQETFAPYNIHCQSPSPDMQKHVMHLIYKNVKAGKPLETELFDEVAQSLFSNGAEVNLLACTELSLIKRDFSPGAGFLDVMEVLAQQAVQTCGTLKESYLHLITK